MVGYHYTSAANWERIRAEGLVPYWIRKRDLEPWFSGGIHGVWLWRNDLRGTDHLGSVLWQLMTKAATSVVKLRVEYGEDDLFLLHGFPVEILHDGRLGEWPYHDRVPAVVLGRPIPPARVALEAEYDLVSLLNH